MNCSIDNTEYRQICFYFTSFPLPALRPRENNSLFSMKVDIEDLYEDIVGKAQRGLDITTAALAAASGIEVDAIRDARRGQFVESDAKKIAEALQLAPAALLESGKCSYYPDVPSLESMLQFSTPFSDMRVNAYLLWDPDSRKAAVFDTGTDISGIITAISEHNLEVDAIFITHSHQDHIAALDELLSQTGNPAIYASSLAGLDIAKVIEEGKAYRVGALSISSFATPGHSSDGVTFYVEGLNLPVAIVGDALFAGSVGGIPPDSYTNALSAIREKILTLPDSTILCPGHGPITTGALEKIHNPFFA